MHQNVLVFYKGDINKISEVFTNDFRWVDLERFDYVEDEAEREVLKSRIRSKVYQKNYQDSLKSQISGILDNMHEAEYKTVSEYLDKCYEDGFVGAMYDLQGQGIPMCFPIDQEAVTRAVQLDSKISKGLYEHMGEDVAQLKKHITAQVSRGIATGMSYSQIARNLSGKMTGNYKGKSGGSLAYAQRIARTEGHRIQVQGAFDACTEAKAKGADVVKQWDSTLDARTRNSHIMVDGEVKELEEAFSNGLMFPGDPNGAAAEVIHCRCALLERARWAVGGSFTKMNNFTKQLEEFESPEDYNEFKKAFFSKENRQYMNYVGELEERYGTKNFEKVLDKMTDKEYDKFSLMTEKNPVFIKKGLANSSKSGTIRMGVVRDAIESHSISLKINAEKQNRHIVESGGYIKGKSRLNVSIDEAQKIVNELRGTGEPIFSKSGEWQRKERVVCSKNVGIHVNPETGEETITNKLMIIYSNTGTHIVPRKGDN